MTATERLAAFGRNCVQMGDMTPTAARMLVKIGRELDALTLPNPKTRPERTDWDSLTPEELRSAARVARCSGEVSAAAAEAWERRAELIESQSQVAD